MSITTTYGLVDRVPVTWTVQDDDGHVFEAGIDPVLWTKTLADERAYLREVERQAAEYTAFRAKQAKDVAAAAAADLKTRIAAAHSLIKHGKLTVEQAGLIAGVDPALLDPKGKD